MTEAPTPHHKPKNFAVINRYGFNSEGHKKVLKIIENVKTNKQDSGIVGINLGKNEI